MKQRQEQHQHLSFIAIFVLAANTMNGPGMTTLPDVAVHAGRILFIMLILFSASMASFVCRRMVRAMWMINDVKNDGKLLELVEAAVIATPQAGSVELLNVHDDHENGSTEKNFLLASSSSLTTTYGSESSQLTDVLSPPLFLELTSIVGQSRLAFISSNQFHGHHDKRRQWTPSTFVALLMVSSALSLGLAQMMLCANILDGLFVELLGKTCALSWPTHENVDGGGVSSSSSSSSWIYCSTHSSMQPFSNEADRSGQDDTGTIFPVSLLSVGWALAASASVAMGTVDLSDMMTVQYFLFGCLVVSAVRFSVVLQSTVVDDRNDLISGDKCEGNQNGVNWFLGPNPFQAIGPVLFNFAFVITSPPSAARAKTEDVAYNALGMACLFMAVLYTMVGLSSASFATTVINGCNQGGNSNLLSLILLRGDGSHADGHPCIFDLCMIGLFGLSTVASIPVYCLLAKETLINDAGVAPLPSFILSYVLPWILVALTYNAAFFEEFVNGSGLLILGYANFSLPLLLDLNLRKVLLVATAKNDDGEMIAAISTCVFIVLTAGITMVIVMGMFDNMTLSVVVCVLVCVLLIVMMVNPWSIS